LELNKTHQLLTYANKVDVVGENIDTIQKETQKLLNVSEEVGREVNPGPLKIWKCLNILEHH
jgi:hypothetical protein